MNTNVSAILLVFCYFVPTFMASRGRRGSVFVINLFFGWTFIGWVIALFMAIRSNEAVRQETASRR